MIRRLSLGIERSNKPDFKMENGYASSSHFSQSAPPVGNKIATFYVMLLPGAIS